MNDFLPGRSATVGSPDATHRIFGTTLDADLPGTELAYLALGCYWGAEKLYWETPGVVNTAVGFAGGVTPNPSYKECCTGRTGHAETVRVAFDPTRVSYAALLRLFFENHDPTQGMRQGNDVGSQYRSMILTTSPEQQATAEQLRDEYQRAFTAAGYGPITTEIVPLTQFYFAEAEHQQYLDRNPFGYCPVHATGVRLPSDSSFANWPTALGHIEAP